MSTLQFAKITALSLALSVAPVALSVAAYAQDVTPPTAENPSNEQTGTGGSTVEAPSPAAQPSQTDTAPVAPPPAVSASSTADAPTAKQVTVGATVIGSDGQKIGQVKEVKEGSGGVLSELRVKHGGIWGFGGKLVAIPADKVSGSGDAIRVGLTYDEVSKLPEIKG